jgi:DNA gyrase subunit A
VDEIPVLGRNTQGVRVMRLAEDEMVVGVERVAAENGNGDGDGEIE